MTSLPFNHGFLATELPPAKYQICTDETPPRDCIDLVLTTGNVVALYYDVVGSSGGRDISLSTHGMAGDACDAGQHNAQCVPPLGCEPQTNTCRPSIYVGQGDACDLWGSAYRYCPDNLVCLPRGDSSHLGTCVHEGEGNDACGDATHLCEDIYFCSPTSMTCLRRASVGEPCDSLQPCQLGDECLDAASERPAASEPATCVARRAPGEPCSQPYQCESLTCEANGTCSSLLPAGAPCEAPNQCADLVCFAGACN